MLRKFSSVINASHKITVYKGRTPFDFYRSGSKSAPLPPYVLRSPLTEHDNKDIHEFVNTKNVLFDYRKMKSTEVQVHKYGTECFVYSR